MEHIIDNEILKIKVNVKVTLRDVKSGKITKEEMYHNTVTTVGKNLIAEFLGNQTPTTTTNLSPNYCAVGTGTNAPAIGDTTLQTETSRTVVASKTSSGAVAYVTGFWGATDVSGTLREVGLFIGATATANSGVLLDRTAINVTKSTSETLTIDFIITIS
jgi:hypothetical protein